MQGMVSPYAVHKGNAGISEWGGGGGGGGGGIRNTVESSLLTGVVHAYRCCQQLDAPRTAKSLDCPGGDNCFCITVRKHSHKCVNQPQRQFDVALPLN